MTTEQIISYLKKKYNCDVISKANVKIDKSILKLLPDDFIEKKKAIPMTMQGDKLAVAMVNPTDKYTIREISLSTGRSLNVYCIPSFEYEKFLKEYFVQKKTEQAAKETERIIQSIEEESAQYNNEESLWSQVEKELQDASGIINLALEGIMIFGAFIGVLFVRMMQAMGWFEAAKDRKSVV